MPTPFETEIQGGEVSTLVKGIIEDARQLLVQQLTLFHVELKRDAREALQACIPLIFGLVFFFVALLTLNIGAALLLSWIWPELPLWGSFAIIGGGVGVLAVALVAISWLQFDSLTPPAEKSVEGLKENLQWKTKT